MAAGKKKEEKRLDGMLIRIIKLEDQVKALRDYIDNEILNLRDDHEKGYMR